MRFDEMDQSFWVRIKANEYETEYIPDDAIKYYLDIVPIADKRLIENYIQCPPGANTFSKLYQKGVFKYYKSFGNISKEHLLWSKKYLEMIDGNTTRIERDSNNIYGRTGWDPIFGPLALTGMRRHLPFPNILLLGRDLLTWANTFCNPNVPIPTAWSADHCGLGAGLVLVPSDTPSRPEEWVLYLSPRCYIKPNIIDLVRKISPMLKERVFYGFAPFLKIIFGFNSDYSSFHPNVQNRVGIGMHLVENELDLNIRNRKEMGIDCSAIAITGMSKGPSGWRYHWPMNDEDNEWESWARPFKGIIYR